MNSLIQLMESKVGYQNLHPGPSGMTIHLRNGELEHCPELERKYQTLFPLTRNMTVLHKKFQMISGNIGMGIVIVI